MKVKQSWIFLVGFCLIKNTVSGCVHPDLTEEFNLRDLDLNGVLDRDEICKTIQHNGNSDQEIELSAISGEKSCNASRDGINSSSSPVATSRNGTGHSINNG